MSGNERSKMRERPTQGSQRKRKLDQRTRRTHDRLGMALLELMVEKPMDEVTVQEVLDRASVGRSTFYLHFRDKNDLLLSQLEVFLATMSNMLSLHQEKSHRVVPVEEMFAHIGGQNKIWRALVDCGRLQDFLDLAQGYFARGIERRLRESNRLSKLPQPELAAHAVALAGSLLSLLRWWIDRGAKERPRELDKLFHRMVWNGLGWSTDQAAPEAQRMR
jgi:AcrR family transcriptional regulator